jgi:hypothetical protein
MEHFQCLFALCSRCCCPQAPAVQCRCVTGFVCVCMCVCVRAHTIQF